MNQEPERKTIIIAFDRPALLDPIPARLEQEGYSVLVCTDVPSTLEVFERQSPDLVVTAMHLGEHNGLQLMDVLHSASRAQRREAPIMVIGETRMDYRLAESIVLNHGAYAFLPLPCEPVDFVHLINLRLAPGRVPPEVRERWEHRVAICVLDDERGILHLIKAAFKRQQLRAVTFSQPSRFIEYITEFRPRAILLDYSIPGVKDLELLVKIQEIDPNIPVLLITGKGSEDIATRAFRLGAADYLTKPLNMMTLPKIVERAVEKHQSMMLADALETGLLELDRKTIELERAKEELEDLNRFKGTLLAAAGHDLQAPLVSMISGSQTIQEFLSDTVGEEAMEIIRSQRGAGYRLLTILNNLVDMSVVERGDVALELRAHSIAELIKDCVNDMANLAASHDQELLLELPEKNPQVMLDRAKISRVLYNLLANAVRYNKPRGEIIVSMTVQDEFVVISVSDTGYGIPEDKIDAIFGKFNVLRQKSTSGMSTGLGLYLAKAFVEAHGGRIDVESVVDEGSTFSFRIPVTGPTNYEGQVRY